MKRLRFILGDQLNVSHPWFDQVDDEVVYLLAELPEELIYCTHHIQKICAYFKAMQAFSATLSSRGHQVTYLTLDDMQQYPATLPEFLMAYAGIIQAAIIEYQQPDEYRLRQQFEALEKQSPLPVNAVSTEHFLLDEKTMHTRFKANKAVRMESFYRYMRKRFGLLMNPDRPQEPLGGQWNFDRDNRQSFAKKSRVNIPKPLLFRADVRAEITRLNAHKIPTLGNAESTHTWPTNRQQAQRLLSYFCQHQLPYFGTYQDAMTDQTAHGWSLYHSRLSFVLNVKILSPMEVVEAAIKAFETSKGAISLAQIEGFIRQIIGWREYIRAMYWVNMPDYKRKNALGAQRPLPRWYWTGKTRMHCLQQAIHHTLSHAYSHHIQRLMLTGSFSLMAGIHPDEVDAWYLGMYADAIEWVELPNTRGMALSADGGLIATKPYICSANYINKMSDYCQSCDYNPRIKTGEGACPYNSLYWAFLDRHKKYYGHNPRLAFAYRTLNNMSATDRRALITQANHYLAQLDQL